jgi:hypothetical protein
MDTLLRRIACTTLALGLGAALRAAIPEAPDWALPGSATHQQVPPPRDFHRASATIARPIGIFEGQTEVGSALVPGSAQFDAATGTYTIRAAGFNIWYCRDEFHFLWKRVSGDASLGADIDLSAPGYDDRKAVLVFREDLDDDSREAMVALHGRGLIHLALRPGKGADIQEAVKLEPKGSPRIRLVIVRTGDTFALRVGEDGRTPEPVGRAATLVLPKTAYVGIGFCSHQPVTLGTGLLSRVRLDGGN